MADFYLKETDRHPIFEATLFDGAGAPVDLTSASAKLRLRIWDAPEDATEELTLQILAPANAGKVKYEWGANDTQEPGLYSGEIRVIFVDGTTMTFPNNGYFDIRIGESL